MSLIAECPLPVELPHIPTVECSLRLDQINRHLVFRDGAALEISEAAIDAEDMSDEATYLALLGETGIDKAILTPLFAEHVIPPSESNMTGGDTNETIGGIPEYNGENVSQAEASFHSVPQTIIDEMKKLHQYSDATRGFIGLRIFMFNENNEVFFKVNENDEVVGIPVYSYVVSNPGTEGLKTQTKHILRYTLPHNWAEGLTSAKLDFNYKQLVNPTPAP